MIRTGLLSLAGVLIISFAAAQDYFLKDKGPFNKAIPSPEEFLGYPVGDRHTRHDRIVAYFEKLADLSDRATITYYGKTHELRPLVMLNVTAPENHSNMEDIRKQHLEVVDPDKTVSDFSGLPIFINLGYNVHGNEPSSAEAALLTAYTLVASQQESITSYLREAVIFIDPTINPDGRDRHTQWANTYRANVLSGDPMEAEHNEAWPRGRTNHYWFDLNRDWLLAIHPESRGKLNWYHQWYPNVVTDFHEMGTQSTYFFEPMKANASSNPIMPKENYTTLNGTFAKYFKSDLDKIGSLYFTKEVFDGTYPGYGSSYPDLQGGLALLFEQASSRGHLQETPMGEITFPFTIRNQYTSSFATIRAAVENKELLYSYQQDFFTSAMSLSAKSQVKGYVFGDIADKNRTKAFIDKLLIHKIKVYELSQEVTKKGIPYRPGSAYVVPTHQEQYRMVQTMFETYNKYVDSVFYDASAWSVANFYNMPYSSYTGSISRGKEITAENNRVNTVTFPSSDYAYLIPYNDYNAVPVLYQLLKEEVRVTAAFKPFSLDGKQYGYGTLMVPVFKQKVSKDRLYDILKEAGEQWKVDVIPVATGFSTSGIDLGSRYFLPVQKPKVLLWVGEGTSSYEAGEVWHLLDTRMHMPVTKARIHQFRQVNLDKYNTMVMISGSYNRLDSLKRQNIKDWVAAGNTLITIRNASKWAIEKGLVQEKLIEDESNDDKKNGKDKRPVRLPYVDAPENLGKKRVGGAIFEVNLDLTHPIGFGFTRQKLPVYRNSEVWLRPSENPYATVAKYTRNPHMDGFITENNLNNFLKPSASLIVSSLGKGRVVLFADNPNFRGSWYGTNRLFLNALFFGNHIKVPE
ncbi:zinc carboxypeptidase [Fulvivirga sp. M361]|uniref:M14 family zinc carboxypeptidase n=1 Tax=Fulvivirga sp. M361 TaxID=2594266 RepID=UPI001179BE94|nr:M14 family zinc carboxypeptidase [Fulvivirga sp. M361]TRX61360.1 zinc carboxypeptidase [Fulvivirga sp. M361]